MIDLTVDKKNIWHPFSHSIQSEDNLYIKKAKGAYLYDEKNNKYLDMTSGWWSDIHGYSHPFIAKAIAKQAKECAHIRFSDITHTQAITLTEKLLKILPSSIDKIFFSDSGSSAVEVALKMTVQYWAIKNKKIFNERHKFVVFDNAFHGETFASMSLGRSSGFFDVFKNMLFPVISIPYPKTWINDVDLESKEKKSIDYVKQLLKKESKKIAAFIIEPIMQGAGGMNFARPEFIKKIVNIFKENDVLIIYDEIMTGFGRLGSMLATNLIGVAPDIICLGKTLSGGFLPISITAASSKIYNEFIGQSFDSCLAHGHTYSGNPICCSAAIASLELFEKEDTINKIKTIEKNHFINFTTILSCKEIIQPRIIGSILAFSLKTNDSKKISNIKKDMLKNKILIRPLKNNIYIMPNVCVTEKELKRICAILLKTIKKNAL